MSRGALYPGLVGDALADKIVEMHESCTEGAELDADASGGTKGSTAGGPSATPKEYVSFLRGWFDMHEEKKVNELCRILLRELLLLMVG